MELTNESKTLFIPLLGKAQVSKEKIFLNDPKAEEIIQKVNYDFNSLKQSKWLSMYLSVRALIIDELCNKYFLDNKNTTVIHLGCGLDSRYMRVNQEYDKWYDIDYENVIEIRKEFYNNDSKYKMIGSSVTNPKWLEQISTQGNVLIIAEGLTMYLSEDEIKDLLKNIKEIIGTSHIIFDAYSKKAVKASKIKNPVKQMNAKIKYGINKPEDFLKLNESLEYVNTHLIKKENNTLKGLTKVIFNKLYCGKIAESYYKIYEFKLND